jgi:hypothetical protein
MSSTNNQIMTKIPITEINVLVIRKLNNWKLFEIWILGFGV